MGWGGGGWTAEGGGEQGVESVFNRTWRFVESCHVVWICSLGWEVSALPTLSHGVASSRKED